jgi:hypothetical protein
MMLVKLLRPALMLLVYWGAMFGTQCTAPAYAQEPGPKVPINPMQGIFRADNIGIEYRLVPYNGHYAAEITRTPTANSPASRFRGADGEAYTLTPGDVLISLDDQVINGPQDVKNHVSLTSMLVFDRVQNKFITGTMMLPGGVAPAKTESQLVEALLVVDEASHLAGLDRDLANMSYILGKLEKQGKAHLNVLKSEQEVTAVKVLDRLRQLGDCRDKTILIYWSGHGATDVQKGHFLHFTNGGRLYRSELHKEIKRHNPKLSVILTDCCSNAVQGPYHGGGEKELLETLKDLLLRTSGTVDINASTFHPQNGVGESAWCDLEGGYFTQSLTYTLMAGERAELDLDHNGFVTWKELFPSVAKGTDLEYQAFRRRILSSGGRDPEGRPYDPDMISQLQKQLHQHPQYFSLGRP